MAITVVQKNKAVSTATNATMPTWGSTTVAGNLLLIFAQNQQTGTWTSTPTGYTAFSATYPFQYHTTQGNRLCCFWKIAAGGEATPSSCSIGSVCPWQVYSYEFSSPTGWFSTPSDADSHSAATNTSTTTQATGSTATLAQANELAIAMAALNNTGSTALTFTGSGVTLDNPAAPDDRLWIGWVEVNATTAVATTANWTTANVGGAAIFTFKTAAAVARQPSQITVRRNIGSGA